jgi:hypothetical protein
MSIHLIPTTTNTQQDIGCLDSSEIPSLPVILAIQSSLPTDTTSIPSTIMPLKRILTHLLATQDVESTIVLLPSTLSTPTPQGHEAAHELRRRANPEETPLTLHPSADPLAPLAASNSSNNSTTPNHPLPRNIPQCFSSAAACRNVTNHCSGHGDCYEARTSCFKCKCTPTVLVDGSKEGEGRKTIAWGGGACEKKDVSVPFVLFAGFAIVMAALVAGVIGMLMSMGSEKLPSVLSAGVAGPTARK